MANKCDICTEKWPQAERANQAALGRMYATKEFIALLKKVESGDLVEVVRCKHCTHSRPIAWYSANLRCTHPSHMSSQVAYEVPQKHFCSYGERKDNENP